MWPSSYIPSVLEQPRSTSEEAMILAIEDFHAGWRHCGYDVKVQMLFRIMQRL